jgi:hypothetical protein
MAFIAEAISGTHDSRADVELGVRPFEDYEEVFAIHPELAKHYSTPVWTTIVNGRVTKTTTGLMSSEEVAQFIRDGIPSK